MRREREAVVRGRRVTLAVMVGGEGRRAREKKVKDRIKGA